MWNLILLASLGVAQAENEDRPLRPTTHPADPALSEGAVENFQRLYCEPDKIASQIKAISTNEKEGTESLLIANRYNGWVDVSIGEHRIGRLGPFTTGVINDVPTGIYEVALAVERVQYTDIEKIETTTLSKPLSPGNVNASIAAETDYKKPGLEDTRVYETGKMISYQLPLPIMEAPTEPTGE